MEIGRCSFDNWYPIFRKDTVRGYFIPIPNDFKEFLMKGEFIVDEQMFPDLCAKVKNAISDLNGTAFVKLNFTAPTDAQWIGPQRTMEVKTFEDVIYLLKASTRVLVDLTKPFGEEFTETLNPIIVLKKYFNYKRDREFRVFYKTPKEYWVSSRYGDVPCKIDEKDIQNCIQNFIDKYAETLGDSHLILDLYISPKMRTHLVDIAPWNDATSSCLFDWDDIKNMSGIKVKVSTDVFVYPKEDPAVPVELMGGASLEEIIEAMKKLEELDKQNNKE
ncbi:cell division cycle protein [Histomonas meleagridis]|uniref:cell division cycle protein n=1 Tax=Histomonas meleagridis TaxID=135588 RepID=UPI00355A53A8|nr:cell division cycle protein [Histomonas meleagridis]KAH0805351.1 cell division cycle protein [Histomonas meleagridis]